MVRFALDGGMRACAVLFAAWALLANAAPRPMAAEQESAGLYVVALTEVRRFGGSVENATFLCRATGPCVGQARVRIGGWPHEYALYAEASDGRLSLFFWRASRRTTELSHERGRPIEVALAADGRGSRDAALAASVAWLTPDWNRDSDRHRVRPDREWVPLANLRVTVRRQDAAGPSR